MKCYFHCWSRSQGRQEGDRTVKEQQERTNIQMEELHFGFRVSSTILIHFVFNFVIDERKTSIRTLIPLFSSTVPPEKVPYWIIAERSTSLCECLYKYFYDSKQV